MSEAKNYSPTPDEGPPALGQAWDHVSAKGLVSPVLGGSLSLKRQASDLTGVTRAVLTIHDALAPAQPPSVLRRDLLEPLIDLNEIPPASVRFELERARLDQNSPLAFEAALYHIALPQAVVCISTHPGFLALGCRSDWEGRVADTLGGHVLCLPYACAGIPLLRSIRQRLSDLFDGHYNAIYLRYRGLLVFADTLNQLQVSLDYYLDCARKADAFSSFSRLTEAGPSAESGLRVPIAQLRKQISDQVGKPLLLRLAYPGPPTASPREWQAVELLKHGPATEVMAEEFAVPPVLASRTGEPVDGLYPARSMIITDPGLGLGVTAPSPAALARNFSLFRENVLILPDSSHSNTYDPLTAPVELIPEPLTFNSPSPDMFTGEVALVTGAASGIGKACVESLLARGAAVVGLDTNEAILRLADSPAYLGQVCDITDEKTLFAAFELAVRTFGGLDMMVLNAGVFPPSCNLEALSLEHWQKVMRINLDANVSLLREAFPLLKNAPRYGRVIINASRNVPAPGPGAAAYSASKAALTQLGRIAALEWGKAGVRVNMIHPHAVFDTAIWTDEVLKSRAAKYGITVHEYKTNNVLGVELISHDVGELVAEMCGPLFSKITGAQVPMDGGSDRVI